MFNSSESVQYMRITILPINEKKILDNAKKWFKNTIAENHIKNTLKLSSADKFNINPFLAVYLSNYLTGNSKPESIAKALIYPRILGTSITTSFGSNIQKFTSNVLPAFGSTTSGIDIEFVDQVDKRKKYCQLKAGPNTINKDDVETISGHFRSVIRLAKTNNLPIVISDMIVGVIYGTTDELNSHYKRLEGQYNHPIYTGLDFWHRLTGDRHFYTKLIDAIGSVASEANYKKELQKVIKQLAETEQVKSLAKK